MVTVGVDAQHTTALVGVQSNGRIFLPNGQTITPTGTQIIVNDRSLGITVSPDNTSAAVVSASNFQRNAILAFSKTGFSEFRAEQVDQSIGETRVLNVQLRI